MPKVPLTDKPGKNNWIEKTGTGKLPPFIQDIAENLKGEGKSDSHAIAIAVNTCKRWAAGGTVREKGGPKVKPDTQAKAAAAIAEWEAKKAEAKKDLSQPFDLDEEIVVGVELADDAVIDLDEYELALSRARSELNLAIQFDPKAHPRDMKGRFRDVVGKLKPGESVDLPDGTKVTREGGSFNVSRKGASGGANIKDPDAAAVEALAQSARTKHPDSVGGDKSYRSLGKALETWGSGSDRPGPSPQQQATERLAKSRGDDTYVVAHPEDPSKFKIMRRERKTQTALAENLTEEEANRFVGNMASKYTGPNSDELQDLKRLRDKPSFPSQDELQAIADADLKDAQKDIGKPGVPDGRESPGAAADRAAKRGAEVPIEGGNGAPEIRPLTDADIKKAGGDVNATPGEGGAHYEGDKLVGITDEYGTAAWVAPGVDKTAIEKQYANEMAADYVADALPDDPDELWDDIEAERATVQRDAARAGVPGVDDPFDPVGREDVAPGRDEDETFKVVRSVNGSGAPPGQWTAHDSGDLEIEMPDDGPTARISQTEHGGPDKWSASVFPSGTATDSEQRDDFDSADDARKWAESKISSGDVAPGRDEVADAEWEKAGLAKRDDMSLDDAELISMYILDDSEHDPLGDWNPGVSNLEAKLFDDPAEPGQTGDAISPDEWDALLKAARRDAREAEDQELTELAEEIVSRFGDRAPSVDALPGEAPGAADVADAQEAADELIGWAYDAFEDPDGIPGFGEALEAVGAGDEGMTGPPTPEGASALADWIEENAEDPSVEPLASLLRRLRGAAR